MLTWPVEFNAAALEFGGKAMLCASSSYKDKNAAGYVFQSFKGNVDTPEHTKVLLLLHSLEVLLVRSSYAIAWFNFQKYFATCKYLCLQWFMCAHTFHLLESDHLVDSLADYVLYGVHYSMHDNMHM